MKRAKADTKQLSCLLEPLSRWKTIWCKYVCEDREVQFLPQNAPEIAWRPGSPDPLRELVALAQTYIAEFKGKGTVREGNSNGKEGELKMKQAGGKEDKVKGGTERSCAPPGIEVWLRHRLVASVVARPQTIWVNYYNITLHERQYIQLDSSSDTSSRDVINYAAFHWARKLVFSQLIFPSRKSGCSQNSEFPIWKQNTTSDFNETIFPAGKLAFTSFADQLERSIRLRYVVRSLIYNKKMSWLNMLKISVEILVLLFGILVPSGRDRTKMAGPRPTLPSAATGIGTLCISPVSVREDKDIVHSRLRSGTAEDISIALPSYIMTR